MALSNYDRDLIACIESYHFRHMDAPTWEYLKKEVPYARHEQLLDPASQVSKALSKRGVYRFRNEDGVLISDEPRREDFLPPKLAAIVTVLSNLHDKRTIAKRLEDLGVTETQYRGWLKDPVFRRALFDRHESLLEEEVPQLHQTLLRLAEGGDLKAMRLAYIVQGRLEQQKNVTLNVLGDQAILARLVEAIQRHVSDESVLRAIASDFAGILESANQAAVPMRKEIAF